MRRWLSSVSIRRTALPRRGGAVSLLGCPSEVIDALVQEKEPSTFAVVVASSDAALRSILEARALRSANIVGCVEPLAFPENPGKRALVVSAKCGDDIEAFTFDSRVGALPDFGHARLADALDPKTAPHFLVFAGAASSGSSSSASRSPFFARARNGRKRSFSVDDEDDELRRDKTPADFGVLSAFRRRVEDLFSRSSSCAGVVVRGDDDRPGRLVHARRRPPEPQQQRRRAGRLKVYRAQGGAVGVALLPRTKNVPRAEVKETASALATLAFGARSTAPVARLWTAGGHDIGPDAHRVHAAVTQFFRAFDDRDFNAMADLWLDERDASKTTAPSVAHPGTALIRGYDRVMRSWRHILDHSPLDDLEEDDDLNDFDPDEDDDDDDDDAASSSSDAASSSQAQEDAYPRARSLSSETLAPDEEEEEETPRTRSRNEKVVDVSQSSAARQAYEQVLRLIIRPPRAQYSMAALGPKRFTFLGRVVIRRDFSVMNRRGLRVHASSWTPYWAAGPGDTKSPLEKSPLDAALNRRHSVAHDDDDDDDDKKETSQGTLIYLHGNASCRVESLCALSTCVSLGLSLCAVDCAGSGKSDGDYVSLGHYESEDVAAVVAHLRRHNVLDFRYGLWGRSMGAVTALLYACRQAPDAACLVVDSPFTSLERLCKDLVRKATDRVPRAAVAVALRQVRTSVKYRSGFDLKDCDALARVPSCVAPALFVHGLEDDFIVSDHTDEIYASYGGSVKCLLKPAGNHNATRPSTVFFGIERFLKRHLPCRPLSRTQVAAMSPTYTLAQTTKARWQDSDEADFTLDDLKTSRGCDNVYVLPPWKFPLGPAGHDPTAPRYRSKLSSYAQRLTEDDDEFVSGMSDARQRQTHADVEALFGSGGRSSPP